MVSKKGVKKPRSTEYGKPRAVRFRKEIDQELSAYCLDKIRPSTVIQEAVKCFLRNGNCKARRTL